MSLVENSRFRGIMQHYLEGDDACSCLKINRSSVWVTRSYFRHRFIREEPQHRKRTQLIVVRKSSSKFYDLFCHVELAVLKDPRALRCNSQDRSSEASDPEWTLFRDGEHAGVINKSLSENPWRIVRAITYQVCFLDRIRGVL